jgi:hypothetical protein
LAPQKKNGSLRFLLRHFFPWQFRTIMKHLKDLSIHVLFSKSALSLLKGLLPIA